MKVHIHSFKGRPGPRGRGWWLACVVIIAGLGMSIALPWPASSAPEVKGADIVARVRPGHPRLMVGANTMIVLKSSLRTDPWIRGRYAGLKRKAGRMLTEPTCRYGLEGGDGPLETSRRVLDRVVTLAVVYRVEGDRRYLERCWTELDAAAHFNDWHPDNFLCTAEMTAAFAIGYDWLYDAWSNEQRRTLRQAIVQHGLQPGLRAYRSKSELWPRKTNNWSVVCNGGLAMGALAVADESPEMAGEVLARGLVLVPRCLSRFAPDGAWCEGTMYWGYGTLFESMYLDSLQTACGTDFGLGDLPGVALGGWFPIYMNGCIGGPFNFADAEEDRDPTSGPQLLMLARRFAEPRYAQYQVERQGGRLAALDMIWGPGIARKPWRTIQPDRYFRGVEVATMRDGWDRPRGWFVGIKAGTNDFSHAHLDAGSFVLEAKGVRWAIDLGPDAYGLPGYTYYSKANQRWKQRWTYYRVRAEGHNTLVLAPGRGPDQVPTGSGRITFFRRGPRGVELTADLAGAYSAAEKVSRSLSFTRGRSVAIQDVVRLRKPGDVWWFMQTRAAVRASSDRRTLTLTQDGRHLTMRLVKPTVGGFEMGAARPLATSPHPPRQAVNQGVTRIAVHLSKVREAVISVRFEE